jgi:hypothetical protein
MKAVHKKNVLTASQHAQLLQQAQAVGQTNIASMVSSTFNGQ